MYRILIVGCGYTGTVIGKYFREQKQKVWGIIRSDKNRPQLEAAGITPIIADLTKPETLTDIPDVSFVVISAAPDDRSESAYREIYLTGIANLLKVLQKKFPPNLIVYLSSTGVYGDKKGEWIDEQISPEPENERGRILLQAEEALLHSGFPVVILRLGGIYGPERNTLTRSNHSMTPNNQNEYVNMIHVSDIAAMMPVIFKKAEAGSIYLAVDDEPVCRASFYHSLGLVDKVDEDSLKNSPPGGKRCSNKKLKSLGYSFQFPTFREGYAEITRNSNFRN
ncbi:MAG: SDR family oxidoreductase [Candidatus Omnitrophica bacterium]|nr:SDR family oxidoreductase [Candidatus Omnitrophota bacterium]